MIAYAYYDKNGNLLEYVSDVAVRQGNINANSIYLFLDGIALAGKGLKATYKNADGSGDYNVQEISTTTVPDVFPSFKKYDPKHFVSGKSYNFIKVDLPQDVLATEGSKFVSIAVTQTLDDEEVEVMTLQLITFYVEESAMKIRTDIDQSQFDYLIAYVNSETGDVISKTNGIWVANSVSGINLDNWVIGQMFYFRNDNTLYLWDGGVSLEKMADFDYINEHTVDDVNLALLRTATNNNFVIQLIGQDGLAFLTESLTIQSASTTQAGLMQSSDKVKLDDLPTKQEIEDTYETKEDAEDSHDDLQSQIDAIVSKSDVVDVVGTYAELLTYDTSKLGDKDIIKVLVDETKNNQRSYYRYDKTNDDFDYIGSEGEYYTKSDSDQIFLKKVDAETKYQHKVKIVNSIPDTETLEENDVVVIPSIQNMDEETIIGEGLELVEDEETNQKTLNTTNTIYKHSISLLFTGAGGNTNFVILSSRQEKYTVSDFNTNKNLINSAINYKYMTSYTGRQCTILSLLYHYNKFRVVLYELTTGDITVEEYEQVYGSADIDTVTKL